nr:reverse transcriptase domain-containing protein [Tanacetum cinerariifolium]
GRYNNKIKISHFTQRFEETFGEAWERFKEMLRACPYHGFTELAQIDTFYNGLNDNNQDFLNAAAGGNFLSKTTREALQIIENKSKVRYSRNKPNVSRMNTNSMKNASKSDDRIDKLADQILTLVDIFAKKIVTPAPVKANQSSTSCTLSSSTIPNPKGEIKAITRRSGVAYEGPLIPTPKKVVEQETEETTDKEQSNFQGSTAHKLHEKAMNQMEMFFQIFQDLHFDISFADALLLVLKFASTIKSLLTNKDKLFELAKMPLNENCLAMLLKKLPEKLGDPGKFLIPCDFSGMDVCHALADLGASINLMPLSIWKKVSVPELTPTQMTLELADKSSTLPKGVAEDVNDEALTFNLNQTTRYSSTYDDLSVNRIDIIDVVREEYAQEILGFSNNSSGGNPTLTFEPILSDSSHSITLFEGSDFILEEIDAYLKDESVSLEIDHANFMAKSSIEEPPGLDLKELPSHLEYAYLEGADKLPVIISKDLKVDEKEALLKVLKSHKRAIAWKITDIKGIDPRKEVIKLLDAGMIYPIFDSPW